MRPHIEIVQSISAHVQEAGKNMREGDVREVSFLGVTPHQALWRSYRRSIFRKTALVNGEVAAMWGVSGVLFGMTGQIWLLTTKAVENISPYAFARIYRSEVKEMLKTYPVLENYVDSTYYGAVRMLKLAGAKLEAPEPFGPQGALFQHFTMKA